MSCVRHPLYLTEGEAAELLESPELPAEQLSEMMRSAAEAGLCPDSTLLTVVRSLESLGSTAALGRIESGETGGVRPPVRCCSALRGQQS